MSNEVNERSYYDDLGTIDVPKILEPLLTQMGYEVRLSDGRLEGRQLMAWNTPWHHIVHELELDCHTWHTIMFDVAFKRAGLKAVPSMCQQCWKVVVRPKTLTGLFALERLQAELGRPSKCGIEIRPSVHGLYGGYFYNRSLEQGLECWRVVREAVNATPRLGPDVAVILKRACTEFEHECGPSDQWKVTPEQLVVEQLVNKWVVRDSPTAHQPEHMIANIHRRWIEWAYANGDATYSEYTGGKPLHPGYVTYQHLAANGEAKQPKPTRRAAPKGAKR